LNTEWFFRNNLFAVSGTSIAIDSVTYFYYNASSSPSSLTTNYGLSERSRVCPGTHPLYFY
jgi:hypothetical protein